MKSKNLLIALLAVILCMPGAVPLHAQENRQFNSLQMKDVALVEVTVDVNAAAERLAGGIKFKTISNQDRNDFDVAAFEGYHAYLEKTYPKVHKVMKKEKLGDPRSYSLLYTWEGKNLDLPPVLFYAHMDVVPVPDDTLAKWSVDPFAGTISDGYIWGRGVLDDKGQLQGMLEAAEMKIQEGWQPSRTIYFLFGQDEEVGGPEGAEHVAKVFKERGITKFAYVADESYMLVPGIFPGIPGNTALIGIAQKGYLSLELSIEGQGGHSSEPPVQSIIGILSEAIVKLEKAQFPYRIDPAIRAQYRYLGPEMDKDKQPMFAAVAFGKDGNMTDLEKQFIEEMAKSPFTQASIRTSMATTMFNAGIKDNVLPNSASAVVNFRNMAGDTVESIIEHVKKAINDDRISIKDISASINASSMADPYGDAYKMTEKTIRQIWGNDLIVAPVYVSGGSDGKWFMTSDFDAPVYGFRAIQVENMEETKGFHGINERILVREHGKTIAYFSQLLSNLEDL
jgi:carboxypeptidase PM20D1